MRSVVGGIRSRERRSAKAESRSRTVPGGALGLSRGARPSERLPFQRQRRRRRERGGSRDTQRRTRPRMRAARCEEMCHDRDESRIDRSARRARHSLGGATHSAGGATRSLGGAPRSPGSPGKATGGATPISGGRRDVAGRSRRSPGRLRSSPVGGDRGSRHAHRERSPSEQNAERPLLFKRGALPSMGRPGRDERGARRAVRGAAFFPGGPRRSARRSVRGAGVTRHTAGFPERIRP